MKETKPKFRMHINRLTKMFTWYMVNDEADRLRKKNEESRKFWRAAYPLSDYVVQP